MMRKLLLLTKMSHTLQKFSFQIKGVIDFLLVGMAWGLAFIFRFSDHYALGDLFNFSPGAEHAIFLQNGLFLLPILLGLHVGYYGYFGIFRTAWRTFSMHDAIKIGQFLATVTLSLAFVAFLINRAEGLPRSVFVMFFFTAGFLMVGFRVLLIYGDSLLAKYRVNVASSDVHRILLVGTRKYCDIAAKSLSEPTKVRLEIVGFVDKRPTTDVGIGTQKLRFLGTVTDFPKVLAEYQVDRVVLIPNDLGAALLRRLSRDCAAQQTPLISWQELANSEHHFHDFFQKPLNGDDDIAQLIDCAWLRGKTVLVTGGGGSIGRELCLQLAALQPAKLIVVDQSESALFFCQQWIRAKYPQVVSEYCLRDVRDMEKLRFIWEKHRPHRVFHAAAYKHVGLLEHPDHLDIAFENNLLGTMNVVDLSFAYGCESVTVISTDKAVNPRCVMGMTKRLAEQYCYQKIQTRTSESRTKIAVVRFGNVIDSAGSVMPIFRQQLLDGEPLTVTHPEVERFFMTIAEACNLILLVNYENLEHLIYVLDMGESVKIRDIAVDLIKRHRVKSHPHLRVRYIGLREGEKLSEDVYGANGGLKRRLANGRFVFLENEI